MLQKGLCPEIIDDDEWKFTKIGFVMEEGTIIQLLLILDKCLLSTYSESDPESNENVEDFVNYAITNYKDEIKGALEKYEDMNFKDKTELIEKVLLSMSKSKQEFSEDNFKIVNYRKILLRRQKLIFCLFKLHTCPI